MSYHALDSRTRKFLWAPDELGPPPVEADPKLDDKTTPYAKECTARFRSSALDSAGGGAMSHEFRRTACA